MARELGPNTPRAAKPHHRPRAAKQIAINRNRPTMARPNTNPTTPASCEADRHQQESSDDGAPKHKPHHPRELRSRSPSTEIRDSPGSGSGRISFCDGPQARLFHCSTRHTGRLVECNGGRREAFRLPIPLSRAVRCSRWGSNLVSPGQRSSDKLTTNSVAFAVADRSFRSHPLRERSRALAERLCTGSDPLSASPESAHTSVGVSRGRGT